MKKIALVSFGSAGTSIMREILGKCGKEVDMYNVNINNVLEDVRFYGYEELEILAEELMKYECVVMTAGLGSTGGDALVKLYNMLYNLRRVCFVISPFYFEIDRLMRARIQTTQLMSGDFEGAIISLNSTLDKDVEIDDREKLEKLIRKFDRDVAAMIMDLLSELK